MLTEDQNQVANPAQQNEEQDNGNPVWEEISPLIWRDSIYSEEAKDTIMGKLFVDEIKLFKDFLEGIKKEYTKCAIVEIGMGTAELFSKVLDDYDMLVGVEISQQMIDLAFEIHKNLDANKDGKVRLQCGNAVELNKCITETIYPADHEFWAETTLRLNCLCMNTFGILPDFVRDQCLKEMFICTGPGGKMVIGCWHQDSLRTGFEQFYTKNPALCGVCKETDFDFEKGNFKCSSSDYTSHWWSKDELIEIITKNFPGNPEQLKITFEVRGVGIFAICDISKDAQLTK